MVAEIFGLGPQRRWASNNHIRTFFYMESFIWSLRSLANNVNNLLVVIRMSESSQYKVINTLS